MTLLTVVQRAARRIKYPKPDTVAANTDPVVQELYEFANDVGQELMKEYDWQDLTVSTTHTSLSTEDQGVLTTLFPGWDRWAEGSLFNRSQSEPIYGPLSARMYQHGKAYGTNTEKTWFRIYQGNLWFYPAIAAGETIGVEYITDRWANDRTASSMTSDTHTHVFDERLMSLGIAYKFKQEKGLGFQQAFDDYQRLLSKEKARDKGQPRSVNLAGVSRPKYEDRVPERNWQVS